MPSRRGDLERFRSTQYQTPQSAEWEVGKPSLQKTAIYLIIAIFLGSGIFWRWSSNSIQEKATATAEAQEARSIAGTVQAVEAAQQVEATSHARTTRMAEAVATAVEAVIVEIRATATALAAERPTSSLHPMPNIATPVDMAFPLDPPDSSTWHQSIEKLPYD